MKSRLLLIALLASFSAWGQENNCFENLEDLIKLRDTASYYRPENWAKAETQFEINNCMFDMWNYSDSVLNVVYQEFHNILDCLIKNDDSSDDDKVYSEMKELITQGQRAWIKTRDADAGFVRFTLGPLGRIQQECLELKEATNDRTDKLLIMISLLTEDNPHPL